MITIKNHTDNVVVVANRYCTKEIPIGATAVFEDGELCGDYLFHCKYYTRRGTHSWLDPEEERLSAAVHDSTIPLATVFAAEDGGIFELTETEKGITTFPLIFKRVTLRSVSCAENGVARKDVFHAFAREKDKRCVLAWLYVCIAVQLCLSVLLFAAFFAVVAILFALCAASNLHLLFAVRGWQIDTDSPVTMPQGKRKSSKLLIMAGTCVAAFLLSLPLAWFLRDTPEAGILYVDGKAVETQDLAFYQERVEVPFLALITHLGGSVTWSGDTAEVTYLDQSYTLRIGDTVTLYREGEDLNYFAKAPSADIYVCKAAGREILLDITTLDGALALMGEFADITADRETMTVTVIRSADEAGM